MLLPYNKQIKNIEDVKEQIAKIILNQHKQIETNLKTSVAEIQNLLSQISETTKNITFRQNIELPDIDHDLELMINMLNHMRETKKLKVSKMPLLIHPDEILIVHKEGRFRYGRTNIISQIAIVFLKGRVKYVGLVIDRNYVLLQNRLIDLFR